MAPTIFPSMYTGDPDIPANTPVFSTFDPVNFAMIADCRVPEIPEHAENLDAELLRFEPLKTVLAVPFMPGRRSSSGNISGGFGAVRRVLSQGNARQSSNQNRSNNRAVKPNH